MCQCSLTGSESQEVDEEEEGQTPDLISGPNGVNAGRLILRQLDILAALLQESVNDI